MTFLVNESAISLPSLIFDHEQAQKEDLHLRTRGLAQSMPFKNCPMLLKENMSTIFLKRSAAFFYHATRMKVAIDV